MFKRSLTKALLVSALFASNLAISAEIPLLNHNFDSDALPPHPGYTTRISGWVDSGLGQIGVYAPYIDGARSHGQVGYLHSGGRISQTANTNLSDGETYQLHFDIGQVANQNASHFMVRFKANGLVLAQEHSDNFNVAPGTWSSGNLSFVANSSMPIGEPLVVEFHNLATATGHEVVIDNVQLTNAGTIPTDPQDESISNLSIIVKDKTLLVPDQYPDINAALRYLDDKQIKVGKTVTIQVTDCTNQVYTESVNVTHPNGDAIHIIGDTENPENCVLQFNGVSGIVAENSNKIGYVNGFTLNGNHLPNSKTAGFLAARGASIILGKNIQVTGFFNGFDAQWNSFIQADYTMAYENEHRGYTATWGSSISAIKSHSINNGISGTSYFAAYKGLIDATGSTVDSILGTCYIAEWDGYIFARNYTNLDCKNLFDNDNYGIVHIPY